MHIKGHDRGQRGQLQSTLVCFQDLKRGGKSLTINDVRLDKVDIATARETLKDPVTCLADPMPTVLGRLKERKESEGAIPVRHSDFLHVSEAPSLSWS
jgi:hypothetical protein